MKKSISIFLIIILITQLLVFITPTKIYASGTNKETSNETKDTSIGGMMSSAKKFLEVGEDDAIDEVNLAAVNKTIYNLFLAVAIVIAVGVGAYLGIKIMTGTIEEKAKIKEMLVPYIVGVVVIFAVFPIWNFVVQTGTGTIGDGAHAPQQEEVPLETIGIGTSLENCVLYTEPDENSDVICTIIAETRLDVLSWMGEYYKVQYNNYTGWVSNKTIIFIQF